MIDLPRLIACGVGPTAARAFEPHLTIACAQFGIVTLMQQAGFIAQAMHESANFTHLEESLYYSTPQNITRAFDRLKQLDLNELAKLCRNPRALAIAAYSYRNGNGPPESQDGWTYRGAGLFQLTGRSNFEAAGNALSRPYGQQPGLLRVPGLDAAMSAAWFWSVKGCNAMMTNGQFDETTHIINGGMNGAADRRALYSTCLEVFR